MQQEANGTVFTYLLFFVRIRLAAAEKKK